MYGILPKLLFKYLDVLFVSKENKKGPDWVRKYTEFFYVFFHRRVL